MRYALIGADADFVGPPTAQEYAQQQKDKGVISSIADMIGGFFSAQSSKAASTALVETERQRTEQARKSTQIAMTAGFVVVGSLILLSASKKKH